MGSGSVTGDPQYQHIIHYTIKCYYYSIQKKSDKLIICFPLVSVLPDAAGQPLLVLPFALSIQLIPKPLQKD